MDVKKSVDEYEKLITKYNVKEIFDDSGVWYRGQDARNFANEIIKRDLHKNCYFGFNTRFEYLDEETIKLLAKANFRFVLIGLESGNNETLINLKKGYTRETVKDTLRLLTKYGLHPHLTIMVGYYWETKKMLDETVDFVRELMFKGYARTLQVTLCTPLDYTPYHQECIDKGKLLTNDYNDHDMSKLIVKTPIDHNHYYNAVKKMYLIAIHPIFILRQFYFLFSFKKRDWQFFFTYSIRAFRRVRQHIFNLTKANKKLMSNNYFIIVPCHNEENNIDELISKINLSIKNYHQYKILFIDDGSKDNSWSKIDSMCNQNEKILGIKLSRNFGKDSAIEAGLNYLDQINDYKFAIIIDADLQHPVEKIEDLIDEWNKDYKIVTTYKMNNVENFFRKAGSDFFLLFDDKLFRCKIYY